MLNKVIEEINAQGKSFKKFSNEWNVMQQLIDIISFQPACAEIVYQDLQIEEMKLPKLVNKIVGKKIADPYKVMEEICSFYSVPCPAVLPPEIWRTAEENSASGTTPIQSSEPISLLDLL